MLMRTSKIITIAVAFALMVSALMPILGVGPVANAAADDPVEVKIGMLNPITGPQTICIHRYYLCKVHVLFYQNMTHL